MIKHAAVMNWPLHRKPHANSHVLENIRALGFMSGATRDPPEHFLDPLGEIFDRSNAAKFTPEGGKIRVETRRINSDAELAVVDTGPGISSDDQAELFRNFTQLKATQELGQEGAGLGLALVKRLVELHGGRVWVESEVGKGSRFIVRLPIGTQPPPLPNEVDHVLIVENDPTVRELLIHHLAEAGFRTDGISDSPAVIDRVKAIGPSVICLDLQSSGDAWEVLRRLKTDPATRSIPIVVATAIDDTGTAFRLGAAEFLVKPVGRENLLETVTKAIQASHEATPMVLVVDDDPHVLQMLTPILEQGGYKVITAASGQEGIRQAQRHLPHLIVLDLLIPKVDGFDVISALRGDFRTRGIPIIVLTAKDLTTEERTFLNARVRGVRQKGSTLGQALVEEVTRVLAPREVGRT
jgi:CheY-like chemotaxis protein